MLPKQFLVQMADAYDLSPDQKNVFLLRFVENKEYKAIADQLDTSQGASLKRMGQVYNKFGIGGGTRGKENQLRIFLEEQYQRWIGKEVSTKVVIFSRSQEPELSLTQKLQTELDKAGYQVLVFTTEEIARQRGNCTQVLEADLKQCDYLLLLISEQSATGEMLTKTTQIAKELQNLRPDSKPIILPVSVNPHVRELLSPELQDLIKEIPPLEWHSFADTPAIVQKVLSWLKEDDRNRQGEAKLKQAPSPPASISADLDELPPLEFPAGQVDLNSRFYVKRPPIEERCYEEILRPGALIRIKAPRQMGKTSLMARILAHAKEQGCCTVDLSLHLAEQDVLSDLSKFLKWFCASVARKLELPIKLTDYWEDFLGSKINCTAYFEEYILKEVSELVLGLDEVDLVFQYDKIYKEFFSLLRAWYEEGKRTDIWKKFRLVISHSTEVYIRQDINQSPFNVGLPIELPEFDLEQVKDLAKRHELDWQTNQVEQLMNLVGGQPYLVRLALYHIANRDTNLEELLRTAPTEAGIYGEHLHRHLLNLEQHPELALAMKKIVTLEQPIQIESGQTFKLDSMGLVKWQGNKLEIFCELYRQYFKERLKDIDYYKKLISSHESMKS